MWKDKLKNILINKKIAILGFGREGFSTYKLIRSLLSDLPLVILDKNMAVAENSILKNDAHCNINAGSDYLKQLTDYDIIIKSPGISYKELSKQDLNGRITSQTNLFLSCFASQTVGVTGTKGKSTTSSLIVHILKSAQKNAVFVGNIGIPPFDEIHKIKKDSIIVYEMSSHQLEDVTHAPHIAVLLNIFQEHLDHYESYEDYQKAKFNIALYQKAEDFFIFNADNTAVSELNKRYVLKSKILPVSKNLSTGVGCLLNDENIVIKINKDAFKYSTNFKRQLQGTHNLLNIAVACMVSKILNIADDILFTAIANFKGLPHRLAYLGCFENKHFYNDSIATIPEAAIEAIKTLKNINTLITGGFDRGIDYDDYIDFLMKSEVKNIVFTGCAGERMFKLIDNQKHKPSCCYIEKFDNAVKKAIQITGQNNICLLSPAAASYNEFKNFEERGHRFFEIISGIKKH